MWCHSHTVGYRMRLSTKKQCYIPHKLLAMQLGGMRWFGKWGKLSLTCYWPLNKCNEMAACGKGKCNVTHFLLIMGRDVGGTILKQECSVTHCLMVMK